MDFSFYKEGKSKILEGQLCNRTHSSGSEALLSPSSLFNIHGEKQEAEGREEAVEGWLI